MSRYSSQDTDRLSSRVRRVEDKIVDAKGKFSDDVNTKSNRKWLIVGLASTVALLVVAAAVYLNV